MYVQLHKEQFSRLVFENSVQYFWCVGTAGEVTFCTWRCCVISAHSVCSSWAENNKSCLFISVLCYLKSSAWLRRLQRRLTKIVIVVQRLLCNFSFYSFKISIASHWKIWLILPQFQHTGVKHCLQSLPQTELTENPFPMSQYVSARHAWEELFSLFLITHALKSF